MGDHELVTIRPAALADTAAIAEIYNEAIRTTTATFDTKPKSIEESTESRRARPPHSRTPVPVPRVPRRGGRERNFLAGSSVYSSSPLKSYKR